MKPEMPLFMRQGHKASDGGCAHGVLHVGLVHGATKPRGLNTAGPETALVPANVSAGAPLPRARWVSVSEASTVEGKEPRGGATRGGHGREARHQRCPALRRQLCRGSRQQATAVSRETIDLHQRYAHP